MHPDRVDTLTPPAPLYLEDIDPAGFDHLDYLAQLTAGLDRVLVFTTPAGRRALTRNDPLAFALVYLRGHMASPETDGQVTVSEFHLAVCRAALGWRDRTHAPRAARDAWVAPRGVGKSTWGFLILPLWALAHGWRTFVIAFADSGPQATQHLASLKHELDVNDLLRRDYPELCRPQIRERTGASVADRQEVYIAASGAAFMAKGIDGSTLGAKIENRRPDLILFDDIEPDESNYSEYQKRKRLSTILDAVLPMNLYAVVWFLGTTVMPDSIIHDLVRQVTDTEPPEWPRTERIRVHYFPAIVTADDGTERSIWPGMWALDFLQSMRGTQSFSKNFENDPMGYDGIYWTQSDFRYGLVDAATRTGLWVDPATTSKERSDFTGMAVVSFSPSEKKCVILDAVGVRLPAKGLRARIIQFLEEYPDIQAVFVEVNQGGDLWKDAFHDLPVKVILHTVSESKEVRFARGLNYWQRGRVLHSRRLHVLERQAVVFPNGVNDDVIDAGNAGVLHFLHRPPRQAAGVRSDRWV
jgi:hypothetical protein